MLSLLQELRRRPSVEPTSICSANGLVAQQSPQDVDPPAGRGRRRYGLAVSIDLSAVLRHPVTLAAAIDAGRAALAGLLGLSAVPELAVFADRRYDQKRLAGGGYRLGPAEMAEVYRPSSTNGWSSPSGRATTGGNAEFHPVRGEPLRMA